jgi:hypothetical protein
VLWIDISSNATTIEEAISVIAQQLWYTYKKWYIDNSRRGEAIVWSLEEIAMILYRKNILLVIDNQKIGMNRYLFEYIYPRMNSFVSIIVNYPLRVPGIDKIPYNKSKHQ